MQSKCRIIREIVTKHKGEAFRFVIVGGLATGVHWGIYLILCNLINVYAASTIGYVISFLGNFLLSNYFTFRTKPNVKGGFLFTVSHIINYGLHMVLLKLFLDIGVSKEIAPLFVFSIAIPINFFLVRKSLKINSK